MNYQLPEQRPQDFRIFDGNADLNVRGTAEIMREIFNPSESEVTISPPPIPHTWDRDGERCTVCGAKDWMSGGCKPKC